MKTYQLKHELSIPIMLMLIAAIQVKYKSSTQTEEKGGMRDKNIGNTHNTFKIN